jgi:hypothetical protein
MAVPKSSSQGCYIGERNMTEIMATKQCLHLPLQNAHDWNDEAMPTSHKHHIGDRTEMVFEYTP